MGLTNSSVGHGAASELVIQKRSPQERVVALAGNPNVGKSTLFNALTGMNQHTGNWPGKTVANAQGFCQSKQNRYVLVDIPGTYSLSAHSAEEEVARNFLCFGKPDAIIVVCDATCLERNMNLVLQTLEICPRVIVCANLMDEAQRKHIRVDLRTLSSRLGVPVLGTVARKKKSLQNLLDTLDHMIDGETPSPYRVRYADEIEKAVAMIEPEVRRLVGDRINSRWLALRLLDLDPSLKVEIDAALGQNFLTSPALFAAMSAARTLLAENGLVADSLKDSMVSSITHAAESICNGAVIFDAPPYSGFDRRLDRLLTGKWTAFPLMAVLLLFLFWLTISGANAPSDLLANLLFSFQPKLAGWLQAAGTPLWLVSALVDGVYQVLASVISVMLPPMAIFFPLFTLLEDAGYLPRIAYNLDRPFKACHACGKQALTMCMGIFML